MEKQRKFGYFRTSNPFLHQFLQDKRIDPAEDMSEKVFGSVRLIWHYVCCDKLRECVNEFRNQQG